MVEHENVKWDIENAKWRAGLCYGLISIASNGLTTDLSEPTDISCWFSRKRKTRKSDFPEDTLLVMTNFKDDNYNCARDFQSQPRI